MKKLYFLLVAMLVSISASAAGWYFNGALTGWKSWTTTALADYQFTEKSSGVYELDLSKTSTPDLSGEFLIVYISGTSMDWSVSSNKLAASGSKKIVEGQAYSYTEGSNTNLSLDSSNSTIKNAVITLNTTAKTITVTGAAATNTFDTVYMVGDFGDGWSTTITTYPLTLTGTDTYEGTYTITTTAADSEYFYTVPQCGTQTLQLAENVEPVSGTTYSLSQGTGSFQMKPGTYTFKVVADQKAETAKVTITSPDAVATKTIYWDNTDAQWEEVYAVVDGEPYDMSLTSVDNIFVTSDIPGEATTVYFANEGSSKSSSYTIYDSYIYSLTNSGTAYEAPKDYSAYWVNVIGTFNTWLDNGVQPDANGISKHEGLAIGTSEFKVKVWDGAENWLSTGGAIAQDQWVAISGNANDNMTIAGATEGQEFDVEFDVNTNSIRVTSAAAKDYTSLYVNIRGDFNNWEYDGVNPDADGIAVCPAENVNTVFKVAVYDPATAADAWYSTGEELAANAWVDVPGNIDPGMTLPEDLQSGNVVITFNCKTKQIKVEKGEASVEGILVDSNVAPVYYNLQGVRVENPSNGLFIVVRGNNVAKEIVK